MCVTFLRLQCAELRASLLWLQIFAIHGIGGLVGNILTGIFARRSLIRADGSAPIKGGAVNGNGLQIVWQLANSAAGLVWSFGMTVCLSIYFPQPFLIVIALVLHSNSHA
jgi:ammonia channel protein AmtB